MSASTAKGTSRGASPGATAGGLSRLQQRLQAARERLEGGVASALNTALTAAGLDVSIQPATPKPPAGRPAAASVAAAAAPGPAAPAGAAAALDVAPPPPAAEPGPRPFPSADALPLRPGAAASTVAPAPKPIEFAPLPPAAKPAASPWARLIEPLQGLTATNTAPAAPRPVPQGPTPVQVMNAVQSAVVGAVKVVSGTIDGVGAALDAGRAAGKTASGAASVASGLATVASGFYPQLAALGIGVQKAPKNKTGAPPRRRKVSEILAKPIGSPQAAAASAGKPMKRVQRLPMVRPKSSLALSRKDSAPKPRSYADLQMKPQIGLTPHEILLKVATIALGKTLLGFLEAGARSQQKALQAVSERMSQKQIMLLGMLPAQYIVKRLPQAQPETPAASKEPSRSESAPEQTSSGFKIRY
ncbi:MAG: hypothetical protein U1A78_35665 [Polyangia bacterium]